MATRQYLIGTSFKPETPIDSNVYPFSIPAVRALGNLQFHPRVTFLVGENGAGKSTVLEALAIGLGFGPEGGTKNVRFSTTESVSPLHESLRIARGRQPENGYFLRAESFFNVATYMDQVGYLEGYGGKSLHARSHGEAFLTLLVDKFQGNGLYLLDEPEAALSPMRQLAAMRAIHQLVCDGSQFVVATHSPILLAYPDSLILMFDERGITPIKYEETRHYTLTKDFLNHYPRRLEMLLKDE